MAAAGAGMTSPLPFAHLLHLQPDGTYTAEKSVDLSHFLFLVIHHNTYSLRESDVVVSRHRVVYSVISKLARAIMAGSPPECPLIPFENTTPRLKGLTDVQKEHLETVLLRGAPKEPPPLLKDLRRVSPYLPEANDQHPWSQALCRRTECYELSSQAWFMGRKRVVTAWQEKCFRNQKVEGIKYAFAKPGGAIRREIVKGFIQLVVRDGDETPAFKTLLEELARRGVAYPGTDRIIPNLIKLVLVPAIIKSGLTLKLPPEPLAKL